METVNLKLAQLLNQALPIARQYKTEAELRGDLPEVLAMPEASAFVTALDRYRKDGERLANEHVRWLIANPYIKSGGDVSVIKERGLEAICHNHATPRTVAKLSVSADEITEADGTFTLGRGIRYSDLTYSHHKEKIERGKLLCDECSLEAEITPFSEILRVMSAQPNKRRVEDTVILTIAREFFPAQHKKKGNRFPAMLKAELEKAFDVGPCYTTLYHALEQTRCYAVTIADIFSRTAATLATASGKPSFLAAAFSNEKQKKAIIERIEQLAAEYIKPPLVAVTTRIKGVSLADKYLVRRYICQINAGLAEGDLEQFLKGEGIPERPRDEQKKPVKYEPPDIRDIIGVTAIVHGDAVTYDAVNGHTLPPGESKGQQKVYDLLWTLAPYHKHITGNDHLEKIPPEGAATDTRGLIINPKDVEDYIAKPKPSGYRAVHLAATLLHLGYPIPFELHIKSNYMDTLAEMERRQSHNNKKREWAAIVDWLVIRGYISPAEVLLTRTLLSPNTKYRQAM